MDFIGASQMPAITWHYLQMNDARIQIPAGLALAPCVEVSEPWLARGAADEFENALADAQERWEATHPEPTAAEVAVLEEAREAEAGATYGGTARSTYQETADAVAEARSLVDAFEHGVDDEVAAYLRYAAGDRVVVNADPGQTVSAQVVVSAVADAVSVAAVDAIAGEGAVLDLSVVVECADGAVELQNAVAGSTIRVFADEGAKVSVTRLQALCDGAVDIDDMALFAAENGRIDVRQTVLGARSSYTGLACDLRGDQSNLTIDTRYLGQGDQQRDFNYIVRQHGRKTESSLAANGVLAGASSKCLRGTIDFVRGCCGSEGSENETVLLVDEGVRNKTVPTLLCNEDDVAGNHGATIGHVREEQLFYLASRGLSQEAAERMFVSALAEQAVLDAADDRARQAALSYGNRLKPGFSDLFDEEA